MTDVSKAMELLEVAEKWLEPFDVTDPFSKLRLEGYLSLKPDYRVLEAYAKIGINLAADKASVMRKLSTEFPKTLMKKVFTLISWYGDV